jgi:palmitoyltransferase
MWFIVDAVGIALGTLTWLLVVFADWVVCRHVLLVWFSTDSPRLTWLPYTDLGALLFFSYQFVVGLAFVSHIRAVTTDPGTIREKDAPSTFESPKLCKLCGDRWKPPRAHHCKTCHRCIFRMDHHCPWINNCVGLENQKFFILFLSYISMAAIVTLVFLGSSAGYWLWSQPAWSDASMPSSVTMICAGLACVECLAVVLFVSDFLQEQIESIQMNSTLVETYQRTHGERSTFAAHFRTIFGPQWWWWPLPVHSTPTADYSEAAIPDDLDSLGLVTDDVDNLGIAGEEFEAPLDPLGPTMDRFTGMRPRPVGRSERLHD